MHANHAARTMNVNLTNAMIGHVTAARNKCAVNIHKFNILGCNKTIYFHFDYIIYMLSIRSVNVDKKVNSPKLTFVSVTGYLGNAALTFQLA